MSMSALYLMVFWDLSKLQTYCGKRLWMMTHSITIYTLWDQVLTCIGKINNAYKTKQLASPAFRLNYIKLAFTLLPVDILCTSSVLRSTVAPLTPDTLLS